MRYLVTLLGPFWEQIHKSLLAGLETRQSVSVGHGRTGGHQVHRLFLWTAVLYEALAPGAGSGLHFPENFSGFFLFSSHQLLVVWKAVWSDFPAFQLFTKSK